LSGENTGELFGLGLGEILQLFLKVEEPLLLLTPGRDPNLRHKGILSVGRTREDTRERVIVFLGNRIVLVVVAAGTSYGQPQQATRDSVDAFVALIRAALNRLRLVPEPRAATEESSARKRVTNIFFAAEIAR
jgi:hypothetical protein